MLDINERLSVELILIKDDINLLRLARSAVKAKYPDTKKLAPGYISRNYLEIITRSPVIKSTANKVLGLLFKTYRVFCWAFNATGPAIDNKLFALGMLALEMMVRAPVT